MALLRPEHAATRREINETKPKPKPAKRHTFEYSATQGVIIAAALRQNYLQKSFGSVLLCAGSALLLYELAVFAWAFLFGLIPVSRLFPVFFTGVLTLVIIPILYPIYTGIQKIGGESWKE